MCTTLWLRCWDMLWEGACPAPVLRARMTLVMTSKDWTAFSENLNSTQLLIKKLFWLLLRRVGCPQEVKAEGSKVVKTKKMKKKKMKTMNYLHPLGLYPLGSWLCNEMKLSITLSWTFFKQEIWEASWSDTRPKLQSYSQSLSPVRRNILLNDSLPST